MFSLRSQIFRNVVAHTQWSEDKFCEKWAAKQCGRRSDHVIVQTHLHTRSFVELYSGFLGFCFFFFFEQIRVFAYSNNQSSMNDEQTEPRTHVRYFHFHFHLLTWIGNIWIIFNMWWPTLRWSEMEKSFQCKIWRNSSQNVRATWELLMSVIAESNCKHSYQCGKMSCYSSYRFGFSSSSSSSFRDKCDSTASAQFPNALARLCYIHSFQSITEPISMLNRSKGDCPLTR